MQISTRQPILPCKIKILIMWTCIAGATKCSTDGNGILPSFLTRRCHRKIVQVQPYKPTIGRFLSSSCEEQEKHLLKSYHIQGTSTSPRVNDFPSTPKSETKKRRLQKGCGPGMTMHTVKTQFTLQTDLPKTMGGENRAPQPVETLLAAWIGCTQATALFVMRQMGPAVQAMDKMEFDIMAFRDEQGALQLPIEVTPQIPSRLLEITGTIRVYTPSIPLSEDQLNLLQEQTEVRCPVANMIIQSGCQMNVAWIAQTTTSNETESRVSSSGEGNEG